MGTSFTVNDNLRYATKDLADAHSEMAQALLDCTCNVARGRYDDWCPISAARDNVKRAEAGLANVQEKLRSAKLLLEANGFYVQ